MKAIYQNPTTDIIMLSTGVLLSGGSQNGILSSDPTQDVIDLNEEINTTTETSGNLSRRSVWDDEEEVDY